MMEACKQWEAKWEAKEEARKQEAKSLESSPGSAATWGWWCGQESCCWPANASCVQAQQDFIIKQDYSTQLPISISSLIGAIRT